MPVITLLDVPQLRLPTSPVVNDPDTWNPAPCHTGIPAAAQSAAWGRQGLAFSTGRGNGSRSPIPALRATRPACIPPRRFGYALDLPAAVGQPYRLQG